VSIIRRWLAPDGEQLILSVSQDGGPSQELMLPADVLLEGRMALATVSSALQLELWQEGNAVLAKPLARGDSELIGRQDYASSARICWAAPFATTWATCNDVPTPIQKHSRSLG
jgi:hypothetical protein